MPSKDIQSGLRHAARAVSAAAFLLSSGAMARELVVDCSNPAASDANAGDEASPLKSISAAVSKAAPGDVISVKPGIYRENVALNKSGEEGKPIVLRSTVRYGAVVTGADVVTGWVKEDEKSDVWLKRDWTLRLKDRAERCGFPEGRGEQVFVDGMLLKQVRTRVDMTPGSFCLDETASILYAWPMNWSGESDSAGSVKAPEFFGGDAVKIESKPGVNDWAFKVAPVDLNKRLVEVSVRTSCFNAEKQSHVKLEGFVFRYGACLPQYAIVTFKGTDAEISYCVMEWAAAIGLNVRGTRINVRNCVMRFNGQMGLGGEAHEAVFENNSLVYNNYKHSSFGFGELGGCKWVKCDKFVVRNCLFVGNNGPGLWFDIDNKDCLIERNWCEGNTGPGIMYEISYDAIVRNNVCVGNGIGLARDIVMTTPTPVEEVCEGQGVLIQMSSGCQVYNNTLVGNKKCGVELRWHPYFSEKDKARYHLWDNRVFNNVFADNGKDALIITEAPAFEPAQVKGNVSDYNLYCASLPLISSFHGALPKYARWGKCFLNGNYSLEEWRVVKGGDVHSIQWDPFFQLPAQGDYRLSKLSPAIGAGLAFKDLKDDFNGHPRPVDKPPCLGAFERADEDDYSSQFLPTVFRR